MSDQWMIKTADGFETTAESLSQLRQWYAEGRIAMDTYIYHPILQRWMYPREVEEFRGITRSVAAVAPGAKRKSSVAALGCLILILLAVIGGVIEHQQLNQPDEAKTAPATPSATKPEFPSDPAAFAVFANDVLKTAPHSSRAQALRKLRDVARKNSEAEPPEITIGDAGSIVSLLESCRKIRESYATGDDEKRATIRAIFGAEPVAGAFTLEKAALMTENLNKAIKKALAEGRRP